MIASPPTYMFFFLALCGGVFTIGKRALSEHQRRTAVTNQHDCKAPVHESTSLVGGIRKAFEVVQHFKNLNLLGYFTDLFRQYGTTYISRVLWFDVVLTSDPDNIKHILQNHFYDFDDGPLRRHLLLPIAPHSIFNLEGHEWRGTRKMFRVQLADIKSALDLDALERQVQVLISRVPRGGETIEINKLLAQYMTDVLSIFTLGQPIDALLPDQKSEYREAVDALRYVREKMAQIGQSGPGLAWIYGKSQYHVMGDVIKEFTGSFVKAAIAKSIDHKGDEKWAKSFVERAVRDGHTYEEVRDQATSIFLAAVDSVSGLMANTFWFLSRDPELYATLRSEVLEAYGTEAPTYDRLQAVATLRNTFNEVLRLMPPVPFNAKVAGKDTWLPRGGGIDGKSSIFIRKGQIVSFWSWDSHRNKQVFGDDADGFRPSRWDHVSVNAAGYIPFQPGPRVCPGQKAALAIASYTVIRMIQTFDGVESKYDGPWIEGLGLSLSNKNGVAVAFS